MTGIDGGVGVRVHSIILAGGRGRRLQPVTRAFDEPVAKQFCRLGAERSLLQQTIERWQPLGSAADMSVVVHEDQRDITAQQLAAYPPVRLIQQPGERGTGIAAMTGFVATLPFCGSEDVTVVSPADHGFLSDECARAAVRSAIRTAVATQSIVLIGAESDAPRTDFGWIVASPFTDRSARICEFIEKPAPDRARQLLDRGALFNTMLLVAPTKVLFSAFLRCAERSFNELLPGAFLVSRRQQQFFRWAYETLKGLDLSRDMLGRLDGLRVVCLPARAGWTDLGDPKRLARWLMAMGQRQAAARVFAIVADQLTSSRAPTRSRPTRSSVRATNRQHQLH